MSHQKKIWLGGVGFAIIFGLCLILPWLFNMDAQSVHLEQRLLPVSFTHLFGTDILGRSQLARILVGGKTTLGFALVAVVMSGTIGVFMGLLSGYCEGWVDSLIGWMMDTLLAFPNMILALGIAGMLGPSLHNILIAVVCVSWIGYAKLTRTLTHSLKSKSYIKIARLSGANHAQIIYRHILRQLVPYVSVLMAMDIGVMILRIAGLSFLGLGASALQPEWGMMVQESRRYMASAPWLLLVPSGVIFLTVGFANLFGEGLTERFDPRRLEL